ncbi:MAG: HAD family hydrolase [Pseudomonadota bacterium]
MLRGLIFDMDGTLVDSRLDFAAMRQETGCPADMGLLEFADTLGKGQRTDVMAIIRRHELAGAERAQWMPGADAFLQRAARHGLPLAIVTRNSREVSELTFAKLGADPLYLVTREDAAPKPDPAGLQKVASHWQIDAAHLAYVGDFVFDLEAAHNAGMEAILYLQPKNRGYADRADRTFAHFDELAEQLAIAP